MLELVNLLSEPPIQHLSFATRAAIHSGLWVLWLLFLQSLIQLAVFLLSRVHLKHTARAPKLSMGRMLAEDTLGYAGWTWMLGLYAAWINPGGSSGAGGASVATWDYSCPNLILVGYYATAVLMAYDAYSYLIHRFMHANKTAFRLMHAKHHEHKAALDVTTSGYMALTEGVFSSAIPMTVLYHVGRATGTGNWWYTLAGLWNCFHIVIMGHSGVECNLTDVRDLLMSFTNPWGLWYMNVPCHATPSDHEDHHRVPTQNYAFFFTYWDDRYGSSSVQQQPCSILLLALHAAYQAVFMLSLYMWATQPMSVLALYIFVYWVVPPAAAAAAAQLMHLPEVTRWLLGWLMDAYREHSCITYAAPGTPGAFTAVAVVAAGGVKAATAAQHEEDDDDGSDDTVALKDTSPAVQPPQQSQCYQQQQQQQPVYLFACHPVGLMSRGVFATFAARGWRSPVSGLAKVRLAVGSQLFRTPLALFREGLLACGCITADRDSVSHALRSGCSVAITPGGWRETAYNGSYSLVLNKRRGFVQLAAESGALLVPVLSLGEEAVSGRIWKQAYRVVKQFRPYPIQVVFGEPIAPRQGESVTELHSRYTAALLALGKQHGVKLQIVE